MRQLRFLIGLGLCTKACLLTNAAAQVGGDTETLYEFSRSESNSRFGKRLANAGDVDADGVDDIIVGASRLNQGGVINAGAAFIYSGATGLLIRKINDPNSGEILFGGTVNGAGDVNNDGFDDVVVGGDRTYANLAWVFSGRDGSILYVFSGLGIPGTFFGNSSAGVGDVNADGFDDVGIYGDGGVEVYSGANGQRLFRFSSVDSNGNGKSDLAGAYLESAGDWNQDGYDDIFNAGPRGITVWSGFDGTLILEIDPPVQDPLAFGGFSADLVEDLNQDGFPDILWGAPMAPPFGEVYVLSGMTGEVLEVLRESPVAGLGSSFGWSVAGFTDVDGDRVQDLVIGSPFFVFDGPELHIYSGATFEKLAEYHDDLLPELGYCVDGLDDLDGDGYGEFVVGADYEPEVRVFSFKPYLYAEGTEISAATGGSIRYRIDFPDSEATLPYAVLVSGTGTGPSIINGLEVPLSHDAYLQRSLQGTAPFGLLGAYGFLNPIGNGFARIIIGPGQAASVIGRTFYLAAVSYDSVATPRLASIAKKIKILP